ncbi:hypothetical protein [Nocardia sp. NPDC004604]|uniref:hypothetical protein n=1 Tax=Nocardia sp. NPDC004604 TaxID=3157013 RepID=UPI0033AADBA5
MIAAAGAQATSFLSPPYFQVGVTLMIQFLAPIVAIAWNWAVRGRQPSGATLLAAAVALSGAALVIGGVDVAAAGRIRRASAADRRGADDRRHRAGPQRRKHRTRTPPTDATERTPT